MRLHRFYAPNLDKNSEVVVIDDDKLLHQWRNVFKMKMGQRLVLFDGSGLEMVAKFESLKKEDAILRVEEKIKGIIPDGEVWLFFSLIKKDNIELVLQKCTELGVSHFVPVISERSEKKGFNIERAEKILIEASEQCGRSDIPKLHEMVSLGDAVEKYKNEMNLAAFDSSGVPDYPLQPTDYPLGLLVGPEGGFSEHELALFKQSNIPLYSLGRLTLRAETAAIAAASLALI